MNLSLPDSILVEAVLAGDSACFEELVRRFQTTVLRYFLLHHRREDALDLTQETFLHAWKSLRTYDAHWRFSTWLLAIAHQQNALFFRNQARSIQKKIIEGDSDFFELEAAAEHSGFQEIARSEESENLWNTIHEKLSSEQAEVLWLFYAEEKSQQEIAQILHRTVPGVKTLLFRARQALQKFLV